jgi:hypothetical protein
MGDKSTRGARNPTTRFHHMLGDDFDGYGGAALQESGLDLGENESGVVGGPGFRRAAGVLVLLRLPEEIDDLASRDQASEPVTEESLEIP